MLDGPDWRQGVVPGQFTLGGNGTTLVAVANTAVVLHAALQVQMVAVEALSTNAGSVRIGVSTVTNDNTATGGLELAPGAMLAFPVVDLSQVWVTGAAGDGVTWLYWT